MDTFDALDGYQLYLCGILSSSDFDIAIAQRVCFQFP